MSPPLPTFCAAKCKALGHVTTTSSGKGNMLIASTAEVSCCMTLLLIPCYPGTVNVTLPLCLIAACAAYQGGADTRLQPQLVPYPAKVSSRPAPASAGLSPLQFICYRVIHKLLCVIHLSGVIPAESQSQECTPYHAGCAPVALQQTEFVPCFPN